MKEILSRPKRQPESNLKESFEEENEPKLQSVTGDIIIISKELMILLVETSLTLNYD